MNSQKVRRVGKSRYLHSNQSASVQEFNWQNSSKHCQKKIAFARSKGDKLLNMTEQNFIYQNYEKVARK